MPGHFVSDGTKWTADKIIPRGPSHDRMGVTPGDVLLRDKDGKPLEIPDPAAVAFIEEQEGKGSTSIPAAPYTVDPMTEMAKKMVGKDDSAELKAQLAEMKAEIAAMKKGDKTK